MNSMPFPIFRIIQGFSYPHKSKIFTVGTWDTHDLEGIHTISSILETDTHIVLTSDDDDNLDLYLEKFHSPQKENQENHMEYQMSHLMAVKQT